MSRSYFYIEKISQTFADNLAAFGAAYLLDAIASGNTNIRIEDMGPAYSIVCEPEWQQEWVDEVSFFTGAPFLMTIDAKSQQKVIKGADVEISNLPISPDLVVDYEIERQKTNEFFSWRRGLTKDELNLLQKNQLASPPGPHPDWDLFRAINPGALQSYNKLVSEWFRGRTDFPEMITILLYMLSQVPNNISSAEQAWESLCKRQGWPVTKRVTAIQLLNPAQGKGSNAAKTVWSSPGNLDSFWILEYLKIVGMRYGGFTRLVKGAKDRKSYTLIPTRLAWNQHIGIMQKFRQRMAGTAQAIQMDILFALRYTSALLDHCSDAQGSTLAAMLLGQSPNYIVDGLMTAYYKDMGNATVTMNMASIGLPQWIKPRSSGDFPTLKEALQEHELIVRSLDESHSDAYELLKLYRDFVSANDLVPFFSFTSRYSTYIMHRLERRLFVRPFTTSNLEILFMNSEDSTQKFSHIVMNSGFQNIAYAIRHSTVVPQGRKARGNRPSVEVRYGLGQQLTRKAAYPQDFLAAITEFIHLYNAENAQLREKGRKSFRKNITTADLDCLVELVDQFGSKLVCNMLIAYGYAREPFEKTGEEGESSESDQPGEDEETTNTEE